jgi:hypothetical protein
MNIHEFQGKSLLRAYNVDIQEGFIAETPDQAIMVGVSSGKNLDRNILWSKPRYMPEAEVKGVV